MCWTLFAFSLVLPLDANAALWDIYANLPALEVIPHERKLRHRGRFARHAEDATARRTQFVQRESRWTLQRSAPLASSSESRWDLNRWSARSVLLEHASC